MPLSLREVATLASRSLLMSLPPRRCHCTAVAPFAAVATPPSLSSLYFILAAAYLRLCHQWRRQGCGAKGEVADEGEGSESALSNALVAALAATALASGLASSRYAGVVCSAALAATLAAILFTASASAAVTTAAISAVLATLPSLLSSLPPPCCIMC